MSGSDANETQVKLVWYYHNVIGKPEKKKSLPASAVITAPLLSQAA